MLGTDYTPGDPPLEKGTVVDYFGSQKNGIYTIADREDASKRPPKGSMPTEPPLEVAYPDGHAYYLWPVGLPRKLGFRHYAVDGVRRTSLRVLTPEELEGIKVADND
jgi:hypothetical protein